MLVHGATAPGRDPEVLGLVAVADTIRPEARAATAALKAAGIRHTVMLTGDNERTARAIAEQAGVDDVRANLLPDGKVRGDREAHGRVRPGGDGGRRRERRAGAGARHRWASPWAAPARTRRSRRRTSS